MNDRFTVRDFANDWFDRGYEKGETQKFWLTLIRDVFDIDKPENVIDFEQQIKIYGQTQYLDGYIVRTKVLIEQKSLNVALGEEVFAQAKRYADALPDDKKPRWIVTCNFAEFRIYNLQKKSSEPTVIKLRDLRYQYRRLKFLIDPTADDSPPEEKISRDAVKIVEKICLAIDKDYLKRKADFRDLLSKLCTRLVFCFYADDAGIFVDKKFGDWLQKVPPDNFVIELKKFFDVLDTPENERPDDLDDDLKKFPCVDGGLFNEKLDLPSLNKIFEFAVRRAHMIDGYRLSDTGEFVRFSWREISPPIFGAMFESLLNPNDELNGELHYDRRRKGGIYYTSEDNIAKVIDPLFMDDLREEFANIKRMYKSNRVDALQKFQDKIASLKFLDPACGSGNFLTKTYLELRHLENEILEELYGLKVTLLEKPFKVSIGQFYGIEINEFAVAVAQVALWIAEIQMLQETEGALGKVFNALPLSKYANIKKANALRVDWKNVFGELAPDKFDYIIGNPPFIGYSEQSAEQKADMRHVFPDNLKAGKMDYVCGWYQKASEFITGTKIRCAFVSTNSICQGEQVTYLWKNLFDAGIHIDFAHKPFKWLSDSEDMAHVHCVVVGFSKAPNRKPKKLFDDNKATIVENINAYLVDDKDIFLQSRRKPIQDFVPKMIYGNKPAGSESLIIKADDLQDFLKLEPAAEKFIRLYLGADEFIDGKKRYCLWLKDCSLDEIKKMPLVAERVEAVKNFRLASKKEQTRDDATIPHIFQEVRQPTTNYLLIPRHSSENRLYIPIGFMSPEVIVSDAAQMIPDAQIYHFGILTSSIHMAWMRATCGRLEVDYRYSAQIVYNNFPWCEVDERQRRLIERAAQMVLDVRKEFPDWTFAKLYNEDTMPPELRWAHHANDYAVALAYGFEKFLDDEPKVVAELMKLYKRLTS